jgi:hypothetical protein
MNTILSSLNKTKYVPPSQRNSIMSKSTDTQKWTEIPKRAQVPNRSEIPKRAIQKKVPEFSLTDTAIFPTLEATVNNKTVKSTIMSFAAAAKYEEPKKEEKISEYKPGWVYIRKNKGEIEYKYIPQDDKTMMEQLKDQLKHEDAHDLRCLKSFIARLQWDQDRENSRLGDLSTFHNAISIKEQLEQAYINDEDENTQPYISDIYVNTMSDSENNLSLPENK